MLDLSADDFRRVHSRIAPDIHRTPLLTSRMLSECTGFDVRLKAELFQKTGSYKIRGPLNRFGLLSDDEKKRGVVCSSAGNHAQGVALAAKLHGIPAVVCMAENATVSKIEATKAYGAEVVLHGSIWDEANEKAVELVKERGLVYIHPFDNEDLIAGQGTVGLEIVEDWPEVEAVIVPIGGGGLISGISMAVKSMVPGVRVIGVESSGAPAMKRSIEAGELVTLDKVDCIIDGLTVKTCGTLNLSVVQRYVDEIVTVPDSQIFEALVWTMSHCKIVPEGAAAAPIAALLQEKVKLPRGTKVACVVSGGNLDLDQLKGLAWN